MRFFASICPILLPGLCAANAASAADVPLRAPFYTKAPAMVSYNSWTGFYVGGDIGGARTSNTGTWNPMPSPAAFGANGISTGDGGSSAIGGLHAGYNWQFAPS